MGMTRLLAAGALAAANLALPSSSRRPGPTGAPAVVLEANLTERRAVRGRPLADVVEPAELAALRRFERTRAGGGSPRAGDRDRRRRSARLGARAGEPRPAGAAGPRGAGVRRVPEGDPEGRPAAVALLVAWIGCGDRWARRWRAAGAPRWLAYAALARSGFDPAATAADGGAGLWMLSAGTGAGAGADGGLLEGRPPRSAARDRGGGPLRRRSRRRPGGRGACCRCFAGRVAGRRRRRGRAAATQRAGHGCAAGALARGAGGRSRRAAVPGAHVRPGVDRREPAGAGLRSTGRGPRVDPVELPAGITLATVARAAGTTHRGAARAEPGPAARSGARRSGRGHRVGAGGDGGQLPGGAGRRDRTGGSRGQPPVAHGREPGRRRPPPRDVRPRAAAVQRGARERRAARGDDAG